MRVLVLTPGFIAEDGPACVPGLIDLLTNLKARHTVDIHAIIAPPNARGRIEQRGLSIQGYGNRPRSARLADLMGFLARRPSYDLVWALWIDRSGWPGVLASRILRRPLLLSVMAAELADLAPIHYGYARSRRHRLTLRVMAQAARRITVGSRVLVDRLSTVCPGTRDRIRRTPLGVPTIESRAPRASEARSQRLRPESGARAGPERAPQTRLLAVTTLQPVKQPSLLLEAIAGLARAGRDVSLDIYGYATTPELDRLRRRSEALSIADRIHHCGFIEPDRLRTRYRDYDLLLHASAYESQGMALIEAAAAELPIACFDVGVARELLELGASISIATGELATAAARALDAPAPHAALRVLDRFSIARTSDAFEAVLEEAAG